ncbi:hypothetical protein L4X99_004514, partial [Salmonella enterica]|nr:hypothetical protein [Salmonella enterica]
AEHPGASAQQCARPASRRQRSARRCICTAPARRPPSRSAPIPDTGAVARERRTSGSICAAVRPASITAAAVSPALYLHRGSAEHPGASAQQCPRPASRRQRSARRCTCTAPARHPPSRSAPIPDTGAVARERRTSGGICAAVRPASITVATVSPALYLHRASPSPALAICTHPGRWRGGAGAPNIRGSSAQQCARPASRRQRSARRCTCTAPARHPPSRSAPIPDTGAVARERRTSGGHLRGSAPGQHHGGSGQPGAVPAPCQPVTRPRDLHPSRTLARWLNIKIKYAVTRRKKSRIVDLRMRKFMRSIVLKILRNLRSWIALVVRGFENAYDTFRYHKER